LASRILGFESVIESFAIPRTQFAGLSNLDVVDPTATALFELLKVKCELVLRKVHATAQRSLNYLHVEIARESILETPTAVKQFKVLSSTKSEKKYATTMARYILFQVYVMLDVSYSDFWHQIINLNELEFAVKILEYFTEDYRDNFGRNDMFPIQFIVAASLSADGSDKNTFVTTQYVAHLVYFIRAFILLYLQMFPQRIDILKYCRMDSNTAFFQLKKTAALLRTMNEGEDEKYGILWGIKSDLSIDYNTLRYQSLEYRILDFKTAYFSGCAKLLQTIQELMMGYRPVSINEHFINSIGDLPGNKTPGYSFFNDASTNQPILQQRNGYFAHLKKIFTADNIQTDAIRQKMTNYGRKCHEFLKKADCC
jgi:hypothetical protein